MNQDPKYIVKTIEYLNHFYQALSDYLAPTSISLSVNEFKINPIDVFKTEFVGEEFMIEEVVNSKKIIDKNLKIIVTELFDWSFEHLKELNNAPQVFLNQDSLHHLNELKRKIIEDLVIYFEPWQADLTAYNFKWRLNEGSGKFLFLDTPNQTAFLYFINNEI